MSWHRFVVHARVKDGMSEGRIDGSVVQLVTICLCDGSGEVSDELGEPVSRAPIVSYLRSSEARERAFELLGLAEFAERRSEECA
jgi:hypothetical protein